MKPSENKNNVFEPMPEEASGQVAAGNSPTDDRAQAMSEARKNLLLGSLFCLGGLAFSFISYYFTSAGGKYVVTTGLIIWGLFQAVKGLSVILKILYREGSFSAFWRTVAVAVCSLAAVVYLGQLSVRLVNGETEPMVETEQQFACDSLGIRFTLPAGYSELATVVNPETETTYGNYNLAAYNEKLGVYIEGVLGFVGQETEDTMEAVMEYCGNRDEKYYDGRVISPIQQVEIGGRKMLSSEGQEAGEPELIYSTFNIVQGRTLLTVRFCYGANDYGKSEIRQKIEKILNKIELFD